MADVVFGLASAEDGQRIGRAVGWVEQYGNTLDGASRGRRRVPQSDVTICRVTGAANADGEYPCSVEFWDAQEEEWVQASTARVRRRDGAAMEVGDTPLAYHGGATKDGEAGLYIVGQGSGGGGGGNQLAIRVVGTADADADPDGAGPGDSRIWPIVRYELVETVPGFPSLERLVPGSSDEIDAYAFFLVGRDPQVNDWCCIDSASNANGITFKGKPLYIAKSDRLPIVVACGEDGLPVVTVG